MQIRRGTKNDSMSFGADLFVGTVWTFASLNFDGQLDSLFIEEAGQVAAANVVATATATKNLIRVVIPYSVLVSNQRSMLPENAKIGIVDKFQGHEVSIVLISMVTFIAEDLPRNIEVLYSKNRLNVIVSRAQCLAVVVANPKFLEIPCGTLEQMKLVKKFCWLDEYLEGKNHARFLRTILL